MIETYNIITIGVLDEDKKLVGITEENFKNLLKKAEKLDELQTRMKEIYGEGEELLETFVSGLEQYNSQQEEHPFKARLLTNEMNGKRIREQRVKKDSLNFRLKSSEMVFLAQWFIIFIMFPIQRKRI